MLQYLHVKNLALIDEIEVEFRRGLNILTGETGAGKSIVLGCVNLALGGRYRADILRKGAKFGLAELVFTVDEDKISDRLAALDIFPEDGQITLSRRLMEGRSICRINGETVNTATLREVADILINIHGQHDNTALLDKKNHLELLDTYAGEHVDSLKAAVRISYREYRNCLKLLEENSMDPSGIQREISLAEYEINEIEDAALLDSEDEELEELYRRMNDGKKLTECISEAYNYTGQDPSGNASDLLSRAIRVLSDISGCDRQGESLYGQLVEIDSLLNDFNRELSEYAKSFDFSEEEYDETENRLNVINRLKAKYGDSVAKIREYCDTRKERLRKLTDHENYIADLKDNIEKSKLRLDKNSEALSKAREEAAVPLASEIKKALEELNFLDVKFEIHLSKSEAYSSNGIDDAEIYLSTNPGEPVKPLENVASGGELSRIMLAVKSALADREDTPTLIFDEIDSGISGITAGKVAQKLRTISRNRQVICITHLPQIAASADSHFLIKKYAEENKTRTDIFRLDKNDSVGELARLLGGANITDKILESAFEMKEMAKRENKNSCEK